MGLQNEKTRIRTNRQKAIAALLLIIAMLFGMVTSAPQKVSAGNSQHIGEYKITINYNGVSPNKEEKWIPAGVRYALPKAPSRVGYFFNGWQSNGTLYSAGYTFYVSSSRTFTASWRACNHAGHTSKTTVAQASCNHTGSVYCRCSACGKTWYETTPKTQHSLYVKVQNGYSYLSCAICDKKFSFDESKKNLNDFSRLLYKKDFNSLDGKLSKKDTQKYIAAYKWLSYALDISNSSAQTVLNNYKGDMQITINNADKLINFMSNCNTLAKDYGFSYAETISNILGKASLCTALLNPSSTTVDKLISVVSYINAPTGLMLQTYKDIAQGMVNMVIADSWAEKATEFDCYCCNYGITFSAPDLNKVGSEPSQTPTYAQLFTKDKNGKTNLDRFVAYLLADSSKDFKYLCQNKNSHLVDYTYVVRWLVKPALDKEFNGATGFVSIEALLKAAT